MKKKYRKILALMLSIIMVFCSIPITAVAEDAETTTENMGEVTSPEDENILYEFSDVIEGTATNAVVEDISLREENVKHFMLNNGTYQAVVYGEPVHRKDENGLWQDIDNRLTLKTDKLVSLYSTADQRVSFSANAKLNEQLFALSENGYFISLALKGNTNHIVSGEQDLTVIGKVPTIENHAVRSTPPISDSPDEQLEKLTAIDNTSSIVYNDIVSNVDLEYVLRGNDVKENIIIKRAGGNYVYTFELCLEGLTPTLLEDGSIELTDNDSGDTVYTMPAPYMYDANGVVSNDVSYTLIAVKENLFLLAVTADKDWINAEGRAFPVTVDPTIIPLTNRYDTYINSASPNSNYGSTTSLKVGTNETAFVRIEMCNLPTGHNITEATFSAAYYYNVSSGSVNVSLHQVLNSWNESTLTWNIANQNANLGIASNAQSTKTLSASSSINSTNPQYTAFICTDLVRSWYNGTPNYGVALKYQSSPNTSVLFKSRESGSTYWPYFTINYTYYIEDGVYSLKNIGSDLYMNIDTSVPGSLVNQKYYSSSASPITAFSREALFKISRVPNTERYVIRSMLNNQMSFGFSDTNILTKTIPNIDANVPISDTFAIEYYENGFAIKPYGTLDLIASPSLSDGSNLIKRSQNPTNGFVEGNGRWSLTKYTGDTQRGGNVYSPEELYAGTATDISAIIWSTVIGQHEPCLSIIEQASAPTTSSWNVTTERLTITPILDGNILILIEIRKNGITQYATTETITAHLPIANGVYFFKNSATGDFMQIDDADSANDYSSPGASLELHDFDGGDYQKWQLTHTSNGIYIISSAQSSKFLSVPSNSLDSSCTLIQDTMIGDSRQFWKITKTSRGTYILRPSSGASYDTDWCMIADGTNAKQNSYINDSNYNDEWRISTYAFEATVNNYFDNGYSVRYGETSTDSINNINTYMEAINLRYQELFALNISFPSANYYHSPIDSCKVTVSNSNIDTLCPYPEDHTDKYKVILAFMSTYVGSDTVTNVYWSGHKIATNGSTEYNRSFSFGNYVYMIDRSPLGARVTCSQGILMHELNHQYGAQDHYHELINNTPGTCKNKEICSTCGNNPRPTSCIMYQSRKNINNSDIICDECKDDIIAHLNNHH